VLQSQVDLNAQRAAQIQQQTLILQLKESLNQLIRPAANGQPGGLMTEYEVSDSIPFEAELILEDVQSRLLTSNPSVLLAQKNIDITRLSIDELKADRWPVVQFNSAYNFGRTTNDIAINPALPISNRTNGLNYGFTATVPILNYRNTHRLIRQGELQVGLQQLALENQTSLLHLNVLQAYRDYEIQQQTLELEESNISLARENVNILLESYRLGHITYVQLREAQRSLEEANNRLIAARYNTKVAETELRRLQGGLLQ
jgi:outer membrane protein TolC